MIQMIRSSQYQCDNLPADWDRINEMSDAWRNPKDVSFKDGRLFLHGIDLEDQLEMNSRTAWDTKNYEALGEELGRASIKLVNNGKLIDQGQDVSGGDSGSTSGGDPTKLYFQRMGAQFAAGFYFGMNIGGFDQDML
jgi:hypothetical protein